jgi:hypothetical protein
MIFTEEFKEKSSTKLDFIKTKCFTCPWLRASGLAPILPEKMLKLTININDTTLPSSLLILNFCFFCNVLIGLFQLDSFLIVSFSISSGSIDANPLARSQGQVKLDADKSKL